MSFSPRALVRRILDAFSGTFRLVWQAGFHILGIIRPRQVPGFNSPGGQRVLVIAPHPDDEVLSCGGTIGRHLDSGDSVRVIFVTDGRRSSALGLPPERMAERRKLEAAEAAGQWGFEMKWLGLPEGDWDTAQLWGQLSEMYPGLPPDLLYAPSCMDYHPDHLRTAAATAEWLAEFPDLVVRIYATQVPLTSTLVNRVVDVSEFASRLNRAAHYYISQAGNVGRMIRLRQYAAARFRRGKLAEPFWEISAAQYHTLNGGSAPGACRFRGLRHWAVTDPLAYWSSRTTQVQLKERSCGS